MRAFSFFAIPALLLLLLSACNASRNNTGINHKYAPRDLQADYRIFRKALEADHPSIYWFTPRDSMNYYFDRGYQQLSDSMTLSQFKDVLTYVIDKIHCGHSSVSYPRRYLKVLDTLQRKVFPFSVKVWADSMAVTANLNRQDSILRPGIMIRSVNGHSARQLIDSFCNYVVSDGRSMSGKYQALSMRGSFGSIYRDLYGLTDSFTIGYSYPSSRQLRYTTVPVFDPARDSLEKANDSLARTRKKDQPKPIILNEARNIQIDSSLHTAYMTLNTFSAGNRLRSFFRKSFQVIKDYQIKDLVVDVRSNGGGDAGLSILLTRYLVDHPFKLADSLYTNRRSMQESRYIRKHFLYWAASVMVTRKRKDGKYHFGYFERHYFRPKRKNHFDGHIYIITGGNSFSATTLFARTLQGQKNVLLLGEETGGGSYGNTAWMIPELRLPHTHLQFRIPRFRLVMDPAALPAGRGIIPDIEVSASPETIRRGIDPKGSLVREIILRRRALSAQ